MEARRNTYYDLLGVKRTATLDDIKKAYREIARVYHPDSNFFKEIIDEEISEEQLSTFKKINEAYETLSDLEARHRYDESLPPEIADWDDNGMAEDFAHQLKYKKLYRFDDTPRSASATPRRDTFGQTSRVTFEDLSQLAQDEDAQRRAVSAAIERPLPRLGRRWLQTILVVLGGVASGVLGIVLITLLFR